MRYAKLINNYPSCAPRKIRIGDEWIFNPTDAMLAEAGYLPVVETDAPEVDERHYTTPHWAIQNNQIVQSWTIEEIPITDEDALTRFSNTITGADDPDLLSAAETLITERIKED